MSTLPKSNYPPEEYLEFERQATYKSEYVNGEIFAMAGANRTHNIIASNLHGLFYVCFRGRPCQVFGSDMRVRVMATGLRAYPDISALCGEAQFAPEENDSLLNPSVIAEVLSPPTERFDRGQKFSHYRRLDSLTDYLLVSQDKVCIEHFSRQPDGQWNFAEYSGPSARAPLPALGCELLLADVYDKVVFPEEISRVGGPLPLPETL